MRNGLRKKTAEFCALIAAGLLLASCSGGGGGGDTANLSIDDASVVEGNAGQVDLIFTVSLSVAAPDVVTVDYTTNAGTATEGSDYSAANGSLTFAIGETQQSVTVSVIGEADQESDESFSVVLSNLTGTANLADATGTGTILDDDNPPTLSINDASVAEGNVGQVDLNFIVTLSRVAAGAVSVDYVSNAGTATEGNDYTAANGTLTFTAGETQQTLSVSVVGDTDDEPDEDFSVVLSNPTGGSALGDANGTGTIFDDDTGVPVGLAQRPSNTTCIAPDRPVVAAAVDTEDPFPTSPGFNLPTKILQAPGDESRWFVLELAGIVRVFDTADPANPRTYFSITASVNGAQEGLLGMAFHPAFPATPEVFVYYVSTLGNPRNSRISRIILDDTDNPVNITEEVIITIDQFASNHNGGDIAFGSDHLMYLALGDGGGGGDPQETGQNTTNLLGSMIRIDVLGVAHPNPSYNIPAGNPFSGNAKCGPTQINANHCPEIFAWGFRNPFRWSFDRPTGDIWVGDVGQGALEEIDIVENGGNYGWDCREGTNVFESVGCPAGGFIDPVAEYSQSGAQSVTGGVVYRDTSIPDPTGRYVFADFESGSILALADDGQGGFTIEELINTSFSITSFALGEDGEVYFSDFFNGRIRRLIPGGGGGNNTIPDDLVDTGCVDTNDPTQPASGLVPHAPNAPFWSDGAAKDRWIALPNSTTIGVDGRGDFLFPIGTVLMKNFELNGQLIETRLFMRHTNGVWGGYTWEWNNSETVATRVQGGKTRQVQGQDWIYPSEADCLQCHTAVAGRSLGLEISQQNGDLTYQSTGITANQLDTLDHVMMFTNPIPKPVSGLPSMPDPADGGALLNERARAYLHTNCAQCHRPGGPTPSPMDLRYTTSLANTNTCDVVPTQGNLELGAGARLIAPGDSALSMIPNRMDRRDVNGMPPLGSNEIDNSGVNLVNNWIDSLVNCN